MQWNYMNMHPSFQIYQIRSREKTQGKKMGLSSKLCGFFFYTCDLHILNHTCIKWNYDL